MSRHTSTLMTDIGGFYEYMVTDGTYVYGVVGSGTIERFNYDGTGLIHVTIYEPGFGTANNIRGLVLIDNMLWIVSRHTNTDEVSNATFLVQVSTSDWADWAQPTGTAAIQIYGLYGGHGLATDSTCRYLYVISEVNGVLGLYDTDTTSQTTYSASSGGAIIRRTDTHYYICSFQHNWIQELTFSDPMTITDTANVSLPFAPWQGVYDSINDRFYISQQFGNIHECTPTYSGSAVATLSVNGITVTSEALAICGYNKVYPDSNTYFDLFVSSQSDEINTVFYNNVLSGMGGDPIIKTLSGMDYTVPDYLETFNYLTIHHQASTLRVDCTTRRLGPSDFPYPIEGFCPEVDTNMYPHTYLDTVSLTINDLPICQIDMDTLRVSGETGREIRISPTNSMRWGSEKAQKIRVDIPAFGCVLSLCSDLHLLERHMIFTNVRPLSGAIMTGAVVDRPCHKFIARPDECWHSDMGAGAGAGVEAEEISVNIGGHVMRYSGHIPKALQEYLNTHRLEVLRA